MKTFLLNIPNRLKLKDQELDAQAALCDKPWTVFNDEGIKQLFIFQPDGTLLITTNGVVSNSSWKYIPANKSIIITTENKSVMFHPAFLDDVVFALQQDGEGSSLFMIDENNKQSFLPNTLTELGAYFSDKERRLVEAEQQRAEAERLRIEAIKKEEERQLELKRREEEEKRIEEEKRVREEEEQRQLRDAIAKKYAKEIEEIRNKARKRSVLKYVGFLIALLGFFSILWGGVQEMKLLIGIGGVLFIFALPFIVMGDVVSDQEVKLFVERKINEEKNTSLDSHEKEINS